MSTGPATQSADANNNEQLPSPAISKEGVDDILKKLHAGTLKPYQLELLKISGLDNVNQAVQIRREWFKSKFSSLGTAALDNVPFRDYEYAKVYNQSCEQVVGYLPLPLGVAGPLKINGSEVIVPLATTEGGLVASINRGCKAVSGGDLGVSAFVHDDGMTRAPVLRCCDAKEAVAIVEWLKIPENFQRVKLAFDSTSKGGHANLVGLKAIPAGKLLFLRFKAKTGEAMGMNMVSKGVNEALRALFQQFSTFELESISGNVCSDKKAAAINWIEGRGKSVVAECTVSSNVVQEVFKTTVDKMVRVNTSKNLIGSAIAASLGGSNCHAANIVAAIYLATGQDAAQVGTSSMCLTHLEKTTDGNLYVSCTMPCVEVGTIGGGTPLTAQKANLQLLGCAASISDKETAAKRPVSPATPSGGNAVRLAKIVASAVLAGELNLLAELSENRLVDAHMKMNRAHAKVEPSA